MPDTALDDDLIKIGKIGKAMFENDILPRIPHAKKGTMAVLDITSGDYEIDFLALKAARRLRQRRPDAVLYTARVGYPAAARTGYMRIKRPADD